MALPEATNEMRRAVVRMCTTRDTLRGALQLRKMVGRDIRRLTKEYEACKAEVERIAIQESDRRTKGDI